MNLEEVLDKVAELSREELRIVRKRNEERTAARDHGHDFHEMEQAAHDFHEMEQAADRLDHYAHLLRSLHDNELGQNWRHESRNDG